MAHAGGRPTDYKPELCKKVLALGKEGKTLISIAEELDVDRATINDWCEKHAEFSRAIMRAKQSAEHVWMKWGEDNMSAKGFNDRLYSLHMQNRFGWNKKVESNTHVTVTFEDELKTLE